MQKSEDNFQGLGLSYTMGSRTKLWLSTLLSVLVNTILLWRDIMTKVLKTEIFNWAPSYRFRGFISYNHRSQHSKRQKETGPGISVWKFTVHSQWHNSSVKAISPNLSQTVLHSDYYAFKHMNIQGSISFKHIMWFYLLIIFSISYPGFFFPKSIYL